MSKKGLARWLRLAKNDAADVVQSLREQHLLVEKLLHQRQTLEVLRQLRAVARAIVVTCLQVLGSPRVSSINVYDRSGARRHSEGSGHD